MQQLFVSDRFDRLYRQLHIFDADSKNTVLPQRVRLLVCILFGLTHRCLFMPRFMVCSSYDAVRIIAMNFQFTKICAAELSCSYLRRFDDSITSSFLSARVGQLCNTCSYASYYMLMQMSVNRLVAIAFPLKYSLAFMSFCAYH